MSSERRSDGRRGAGIREWLSLPDPHRSFPCLDGMRALAAFGVFLFHAGRQTSFYFTDYRLTLDHLDVGVAVFFVISGFLIYRPFATANLSAGPRPDLRSYFRRRAFRIYPAYIVALVVLWRLGDVQIDDRAGLLKHLSLLSGYFRDPGGVGLVVAWTLTIEVSFYVMVPLWSALTRAVGRRTHPLATELAGAAVLTGFGLASIWWYFADVSAWPALRVLPPALSSLGVGMLFAVLSAQSDRSPRWESALRRVGNPLWLWWALGAAAFIAMRELLPPGLDYRPILTADKVATRAWGVPVAFAAVLPLVFGDQRRGAVRWLLRSRPAVFAGTVSYAFYLWHSNVLLWLVDRPTSIRPPYPHGRELMQVAFALAVSVLVAAASWYLVERPALRFGRRDRPAPRRVAADTAELASETTRPPVAGPVG